MNIFNSNYLPVQSIVIDICANVGGLKRMEIKHRQYWIEQVNELVSSIPDGYVIRLFIASNARQDAQLVVNRAHHNFDYVMPNATSCVVYTRENRKEWDQAINELFLTKKELSNG